MIIDTLLQQIDAKQSFCVVGLDPTLERLPKHLVKGETLADAANAIRQFNIGIIDAVHDLIPAVKPQVAFYEQYGMQGMQALQDTMQYARSKGLIVIEDAKRNDISSTAQAYANGHLGRATIQGAKVPAFDVDAMTVTPYLGTDGLTPFVNACMEYAKGIFILVKTSNQSSGELQDRIINITGEETTELQNLGIDVKNQQTEMYNLVALMVNRYANSYLGKRGYSSIGAVVGATYPEQAAVLRKAMPASLFLIPGYGAQGGDAESLLNCFNNDGYGGVVNSSRGIIYAYENDADPNNFAKASRAAVEAMRTDIHRVFKAAGKLPKTWQ